jgi:hypothetical protein
MNDSYELYIATDGSDHWTGLLPEPNEDRTDGPLASVSAAKLIAFEMLRRGRAPGGITVYLRGGRYPLRQPLTFDVQESGPLTFAAYPGEEPIFDGGVRVSGWESATVNGRDAWFADVSGLLLELGRPFRSLFVNGRRAPRPRLPKAGYFAVEGAPGGVDGGFFSGTRRFVAAPGDLPGGWKNPEDIEAVALHWWIEERMPLASHAPETRVFTSSRAALMPLGKGTRYFVENVAEALTEPGEWYLDRPAGRLYYLPLPGETLENTEAVIPVLYQFLRVTGDGEAGRPVEGLRFEGLAFEHADWEQPRAWTQWWDPYTPPEAWRSRDSSRHFIKNNGGDPADEKASVPQGAYNCPGVLHFEAARNCSVEDCRVERVGFYGADLREGCTAVRIVGCTFRDLGAGGVKMDGGGPESAVARRTGRNRVTDNVITAGGRVFTSAMGVVSMFSDANVIAHNEISDLFQTGISVGWRWDYDEQVARDIQVEKNHIFNLGQGVLSDMGGIYTLGVLSGSVLRGNYIHDMVSGGYGACGIYLDQGSANLLVEGNVVCRVGESVSMHWGRSNVLRNNVFAFAEKQGVFLGREPHHKWVDYPRPGMRFERNIFLLRGEPAYSDYERSLESGELSSDMNLYWDVTRPDPLVYKFSPWKGGEVTFDWGYKGSDTDPRVRLFSLADWQGAGQDRFSRVADPEFADPEGGDFTLAADSPAREMGFAPIDLSDIGPRPKGKRNDC